MIMLNSCFVFFFYLDYCNELNVHLRFFVSIAAKKGVCVNDLLLKGLP